MDKMMDLKFEENKLYHFFEKDDRYAFLVRVELDKDGKSVSNTFSEIKETFNVIFKIAMDDRNRLLKKFSSLSFDKRNLTLEESCYYKKGFACCEYSLFLKEVWDMRSINSYIKILGYEATSN